MFEEVVSAAVSPALLSDAAMAGCLPPAPNWKAGGDASAATPWTNGRASCLVRAAEATFLRSWERYSSDVQSSKNAAILIWALSAAMVAWGARPTFDSFHNNSRLTGVSCMFLAADQLLAALWVGLSLGIAVWAGSSYFERKLAQRRAAWQYFAARAKDALDG